MCVAAGLPRTSCSVSSTSDHCQRSPQSPAATRVTHTHTHTHAHTHTHKRAHTHERAHTHTRAHRSARTHIHSHTHTHTYISSPPTHTCAASYQAATTWCLTLTARWVMPCCVQEPGICCKRWHAGVGHPSSALLQLHFQVGKFQPIPSRGLLSWQTGSCPVCLLHARPRVELTLTLSLPHPW